MAATARLVGDRLRVGRSPDCPLRVDDPCFHRLAGEILREPSLVFRPFHDGRPVVELAPGKRLRLGRYDLLLLGEGEVCLNRPASRTLPLAAGALILAGFAIGGSLMASRGPSPREGAAPPAPAGIDLSASPADLPSPACLPPPAVATSPTPAPPPAQPPPGTLPLPEPVPEGASSDAFLSVLALSRAALARGEASLAGSLLAPLWPLLSSAQKQAAAATLDPVALRLFQRAYLAAPYDPALAGSICRDLAGCGLSTLPTVAKAEGLLKGASRGR